MVATPPPPAPLSHPESYRRKLAIILLICGVLASLLAFGLYAHFSDAEAAAQAFSRSQPCATSDDRLCLQTSTAKITQLYITHGSKGSVSYNVDYSDPSGTINQADTITESVYDSLVAGETAPAEVWNGAIVAVYPTGTGGWTTDHHPYHVLAVAVLGLIPMVAAVAFFMAAALLQLSVATPDDLLRAEVTAAKPPPRHPPPGLTYAILAWKRGAILGWGFAASVALLIGYIQFATQTDTVGAISTAPAVSLLVFVIGSGITYSILHSHAVRDSVSGVYREVPVTSERILRGRSGAYGVRAVYPLTMGGHSTITTTHLTMGGHSTITITRHWWRSVSVGTHLEAIVDPQTGRIWRLLGMRSGTRSLI